jgi:hypothetical protein
MGENRGNVALDLIRLRKRRDKSQHRPRATLARGRFGGTVGVLAIGALLTAGAGSATAAVKATNSSDHREDNPAVLTQPSSQPSSESSPLSSPAPIEPAKVSLPPPCQLLTRAAAQGAVGAPLPISDDKPTSCRYAGLGPSPYQALEISYDPHFDADHLRRTLAAAKVAAKPIAGLGSGAFSYPAFTQPANGTTEFSPAEAVVPLGSLTVVISAITIDEGNAPGLVNPARDEMVAVAVAKAVLSAKIGTK